MKSKASGAGGQETIVGFILFYWLMLMIGCVIVKLTITFLRWLF